MEIDRIELADLANPIEIARAVLKQLPDLKPPVPVFEIAYALGILEIKPIASKGYEGGLIAPDDKSNGCIVYNGTSPESRQRFTIGHELGHYLNPWHTPNADGQFMCTAKNMVAANFEKSDRLAKMEVEANQFSVELLMPAAWMQKELRNQSPEITRIVALANQYEVSKETMARRYIDFIDESCAVVFSKEGKILYAHKRKNDFPYMALKAGDTVPKNTVTASYNDDVGSSSDWREYDADTWLQESKYKKINEQVLIQNNGYRMTLLTVDTQDADESEEGEDLESAWSVRF